MTTITCKELGHGECTVPIAGNSVDEIQRNVLGHAQKYHLKELQGMTQQDKQGLMNEVASLFQSKNRRVAA